MPALPSFVDLLAPERISARAEVHTKSDVLRFVAGTLATHPAVRDRARLVADLEAREARLSTGVGGGVALPHARTRAVTGTAAALATLARPVDWDAIDGQPVDVVVMVAGQESERAAHVRLLAQVSRVLSAPSVRSALAEARTPDALLDALQRAETGRA